MLRRVVAFKTLFGCPCASIGTTFCVANQTQPFSSNYNDSNRHKTQSYYSNRSGAQHQHAVKSSSGSMARTLTYKEGKEFKEAASTTHRKSYDTNSGEGECERNDQTDNYEKMIQFRNVKNQHKDFIRPKSQRPSFKNTMAQSNAKTIIQAPMNELEGGNRPLQEGHVSLDDGETDVTKIYSNDEVHHLVEGSDTKKGALRVSTNKIDDDILNLLETPEERAGIALSERTFETHGDAIVANKSRSEDKLTVCSQDAECIDTEDETDSFASLRQQPFFSELLRCVEKNMMRYRKEIRQTNRYSRELINDCVRPLLQLTDFPFTAHKLTELTNCINPIILRRSLADYSACKRLHIYRSEDTELLLDWSIEDFLRRRYESIHLSWERVDVVYRRFGWNSEMISDRDCLLYFAEFSEFVELAELEMTVNGKPRAILILDPVAQAEKRPIPSSKLLIRRRPSADVEPSVTESVRLMGVPAMANKTVQDYKGYRQYPHNRESVSGMFEAVEKAAEEVEGDEATKFSHAIDSVPHLKQAIQPIGRVVREFSIGKVVSTDKTQQQSVIRHQEGPTDGVDDEQASDQRGSSLNASPDTYDSELHESLSNAYHKNKVEVTMLRRRLLNTSNPDEVAEIQARLMNSRKELNRLIDQLRHMRQLKQALKQEQDNNKMNENVASKDGSTGLSASSGQPNFPEAPEHDFSKNASAAEDIEDDDDIDISKELKEFEAEVSASVMNATTTIPKGEGNKSAEASAEHKNWNRRAVTTIEEGDNDQESRDLQDSTENDISNTVGSEEETENHWCSAHEMSAEAEEEASCEASHKPPTSLPSSFTHSESKVNYNQMSATSHSEELLQLCEEVSSAANNAREELKEILRQKSLQEAAMARQVQAATNKVSTLEERLSELRSSYQKACETEAQEAAAAKAKAAEEELRRQREIRQAELARQREQARLAQLEAQKALDQQKAAEEAVLAAERQLQEVRARFGLTKQGTDVSENAQEAEAFTSGPTDVEKSIQPPNVSGISMTRATTASEPSSNTKEADISVPASGSGSFFMCTPEQYDGMQLAAARLRIEVASLEKQMEQEGEEDDETLMTVLAASRADLEELDSCISSVQMHASWAAERDAKREREIRAKDADSTMESREIQNKIAQKRFEISLFERRLHHATERSVINKLEQGIIEARRQISRLRMEQDRLRRNGENEFGLPPSISIARALEDEVKGDAEGVEEGGDLSASECPEASSGGASDNGKDAAGELDDEVDSAVQETSAAQGIDDEAESDLDPVAAFDSQNFEHEVKDRPTAKAPAEERPKPATTWGNPLIDADPETQRLHLRLESMLRDIQHLQDNISHQESSSSYDEDEAEAVLLEMRRKLSELLRLRDDVQRRLVEATSGGKGRQDSHSNSATRDAPHTPPEPPLVASRMTSSIVSSGFKTPSIPIPHLQSERIRIASATKKLQRSTLKGKGRKH
ncbi:unnamed protein product [Phytomonas sp. EM1]|nr:unnamed protein product [Phytomonas sp. EM1]|eukprot:CCW63080.1 unnamed protein product [Phytomonas sp. isolate EM1]